MQSSHVSPPRRTPYPARLTGRVLIALALAALAAGASMFSRAPLAHAAACTSPTMQIVAHEDDDLLFQSPDLLHSVQGGLCVRTVFLTAGDAGQGTSYWQGREAGSEAAYAEMAGAANNWVKTDAGIAGHPMSLYTLVDHPNISLVFMHLPDGSPTGGGFPSTGNQSLQQLWNGDIITINAVDRSSSYTRQDLINALTALMQAFQPVQIRVQDYVGTFGDGDHSDHHAGAYFARVAHQSYTVPHTFIGYIDYTDKTQPQNVFGNDLTGKQNAFYTYTPYDPYICQTENVCAGSDYALWLQRQYIAGTENGGTGTNTPPSANAGQNQTVASGAQVQLDGSGSTDPGGASLTYHWSQTSGPAVTLSSGTAVKPTFTAPAGPATLMFQLVVNNGQTNSSPASVIVAVSPPVGYGPTCPCTIFGSSATPGTVDSGDGSPYELGMRFQSDNSGYITGLRFYKSSLNTGTHVGNLWDSAGNLLATVTFANETASGWQTANFPTRVAISPNTVYTISYHTNVGHYAVDRTYFTPVNSGAFNTPPLHALTDGSGSSNGVFSGGGSAFPAQSYQASNYWVDPIFTTTYNPATDPPYVASVAPVRGATGVSTGATVGVTFSKAMNGAAITSGTLKLKDPTGAAVPSTVTYDSTTYTAVLTPSAPLTQGTTYTAMVAGGNNGVQDSSGTPLPANYSWSLTTSGPPSVMAVSPSNGTTGVRTQPAITATFSQAMDPSTLTSGTMQVFDAGYHAVSAQVTYNATTLVATLTPSAPLTLGATYTAVVSAGSSGVKTPAGVSLAQNYQWSFTIRQCPCSVWDTSTVPTTVDSGDTGTYELGMRFTADTSGYITGLRFYKASQNTGTHLGHLWDGSGKMLAEALFINETASGWQTVTFDSPVALTANTAYTVSYHTDAGHFSLDRPYFTGANASMFNNSPLHAVTDGQNGNDGVYASGGVAFPTSTYGASNYWVDPIFVSTLTPDTTPPTVTSVGPANGATNLGPLPSVTAQFSKALDLGTVTSSSMQLLAANSTAVAATVSYNTLTHTATLTPSSGLTNGATYTAVVRGGSAGVKDLTGNALAADYRWSFATRACPCSVWGQAATPGTIDSGDTGAYELGMKFQVAVGGYVTGVTFYKAAANTGTHTAHLWDSAGNLLATATFANETASGWQMVYFAQPVQVAANTTYTVSYHTDVGHYSVDRPYFTSVNAVAYTGGTVAALQDGQAGGNGVFNSVGVAFPTSSYNASNYWVDALFTPTH